MTPRVPNSMPHAPSVFRELPGLRAVISGRGCVRQRLALEIAALGSARPLIVCGANLAKSPVLSEVKRVLDRSIAVFDGSRPHTPHETVSSGAAVARAVGAPRATDAVRVVVDGAGHVVVDDMRDLRDVETSGGEIGGDEDLELALAKAVERLLALRLRHVALDDRHLELRVFQGATHVPGGVLGLREDKDALRIGVPQDLRQQIRLVRRAHRVERVRDRVRRRLDADLDRHRLVQDLARQNTELGDQLNELAAALENLTRQENRAAAQAKRVTDNFRLTRQKLEIAGLGEALGQLLLEERASLPDSSDFKATEERRQQLVVESSLRQIRNQQERTRLRDINVYVDEMLAPLTETWRSLLRDEILELAELRRDLLDKAIRGDDIYLQALGEFEFTQRQLSESEYGVERRYFDFG